MPALTPMLPAQKLQNTSITLIAIASGIALLYYGRLLCITLIISILLAFILEPFVGFFLRLRLPRSVASFVVCSIALLLVYLAGLGVYVQVAVLSDELPMYSQRINELVDRVAERIEKMEQSMYRTLVPKRFQQKEEVIQPQEVQPAQPRARRRPAQPPPPQPAPVQEVRIRPERVSLVAYVYSYVSSFYNVLLMVSFVPFLVYFMLSWRDHIRKTYLSIFQGTDRVVAGKSWHSIATMARAYVFGNFILGVLLTLISSIVFWSWHLPYWMLVAPLSGFLNLVPYIGAPLAIIPPLLAALVVYDTMTPYLIIAATVAFLHLLALNLLYPLIVGARVHLNPLAVTVALMFWGTIWGAIGLILAIPITAAAKAVLDNIESLQPYGRMLGD
ncbi:MAG: AI-2E family transporter [Acidobacteria bacterium]|nr:AI-2E family transporter [Acidobacteriota bacterium]